MPLGLGAVEERIGVSRVPIRTHASSNMRCSNMRCRLSNMQFLEHAQSMLEEAHVRVRVNLLPNRALIFRPSSTTSPDLPNVVEPNLARPSREEHNGRKYLQEPPCNISGWVLEEAWRSRVTYQSLTGVRVHGH